MRTKVFNTVVFVGLLNALGVVISGSALASECEDSDGDGWGWNGVSTCTVTQASTVTPSGSSSTSGDECIDSDGDGWGWNGVASCRVDSTPMVNPTSIDAVCIDSDGDGWGWDGTSSCRVASAPVSPSPAGGECIDSDGDGWGWNGTSSCTVASAPVSPSSVGGECIDSDGDGWGWDGVASCQVSSTAASPDLAQPPRLTDNITDVVLMMGQSNALGENTLVDVGIDAPNDNVIAWTQFDGWQVANLCTQIWQKAWFPWRGGVCSNHPAFQIAKRIVEKDPARRVAVIPTGTAGKPISWWDANGIADQMVNVQVTTALAALGRGQVDLIAWSQGEADHGNETVWALKLNDLISRLRQRPWFDAASGQFIAQETKWSTVNTKVRALANDGDPLTRWVPAADQPTKDGVHWSGAALRVISDRYANAYLY